MNLAIGKDRILSVHQFIKQNTERICIILDMVSSWIFFEFIVIEIRNIRSISKNFKDFAVDWNWFSYFWNSILDVNILDVEHID